MRSALGEALTRVAVAVAHSLAEQLGEGVRDALKHRREQSAVWAERARTGRWAPDEEEPA